MLLSPNERLLALSDTFRAFAERTTDYQALLATVACRMTSMIGDACVVSLVREDGTWADINAAHALDARATELLTRALAQQAARDGSGQTTQVARTGEPVLVAAIEPGELARRAEPAFATAVRELGIHSFIAVALEVPGRRLGVAALHRYRPDSPPFTDADVALARTIADHAALALANGQLIDSLQAELAERRRVEDRAKAFVALVQNSTDYISMASFEGRVLFVNAAGRALVGLAVDRDVTLMTLADFRAPKFSHAAEVLATGSWTGELELRHFQTGEVIPTHATSFLVRDDRGKPLCFATVQRDLRETKRLEAELRQAQKMEALGRLAGGVAHDFNNLLTVILSYAALLARALPPRSRAQDDVGQIERAGRRAAELTHQLLAFSRRQVLEPKALDLGATLRAMEGMLHRLIGEDIELAIALARDAGAVMVDAGQVEQVVMNLVVNARDAMPGGGTLVLETAHVDLDPAAAAKLGLGPGPYTTLSVTDTGTGIDEHTRAHLFEPFFTTKALGKGTGLGLSTAMGIVVQSGGCIAVDSVVGRGTSFHVYLPSTAASTPARITRERSAPHAPGTERILVVEDETSVRTLVRDVLREAGYDVVDAADGVHALELAETAGEIHLLLTDVIMPKISGRQLAAKFLALRPATRVLYMSGYTDDKLGQHGVLDPDVELIQKPLTPADLLRRVRGLLE